MLQKTDIPISTGGKVNLLNVNVSPPLTLMGAVCTCIKRKLLFDQIDQHTAEATASPPSPLCGAGGARGDSLPSTLRLCPTQYVGNADPCL